MLNILVLMRTMTVCCTFSPWSINIAMYSSFTIFVSQIIIYKLTTLLPTLPWFVWVIRETEFTHKLSTTCPPIFDTCHTLWGITFGQKLSLKIKIVNGQNWYMFHMDILAKASHDYLCFFMIIHDYSWVMSPCDIKFYLFVCNKGVIADTNLHLYLQILFFWLLYVLRCMFVNGILDFMSYKST